MPTLTNATVQLRSDDVVLKWTVDGDLEDLQLNPWILSTTLSGGPDGPIHTLGFRHLDGRIGEQHISDGVSGYNHRVPQVTPQRVGNTWTAIFPKPDSVAPAGEFTAALAFDEPDNANETRVTGTY